MATDLPLSEAGVAGAAGRPRDAVTRHAGVDRVFHWLTAAAMFVLLATGLLPFVGVRFAWVEIHWIAGLALTALLLFHIVRGLAVQKPRIIIPTPADVGAARPGKYTLPQKLQHTAMAVALLTAAVTGILMMIKSGTPLFERDPYVFSLRTWGVINVLHDLAAYGSLFLVMLHIYFSLRPESRMYLRSMVSGWVTREELRREHDTGRIDRGE